MNRIRVAAAYEMFAGLLGLGISIRRAPIPNGAGVTFNIYVVALALISVALGSLTWYGSRRARQISLGFQLLQIVQWNSSTFMLGLRVGAEVTLRFQGPLLSIWTAAGVRVAALRPSTPLPTVVGVNLVALVMAVLCRSQRAAPSADIGKLPVEPPALPQDALDGPAG